MAKIIMAASAHPKHRYAQSDITNHYKEVCPKEFRDVIGNFHESCGVKYRNLALPLESYDAIHGVGGRLKIWQEVGHALAKEALGKLLAAHPQVKESIGHIFFTSVTGMSAPSIDAHLVNDFRLNKAIKRTPIFGLGCLGGASVVIRANDYLKAYPKEAAVVVALELCSINVQKDDISVANAVASGLFGDGCAALLMVGDEHPLAYSEHACTVTESSQLFFYDTQRVMGWEMIDTGLKIVLSKDVPTIAQERLCPAVKTFLLEHGLSVSDISHWVAHPGGPKVIQAVESGLALNENALRPTKNSLEQIGNLSSASVLCIYEQIAQDIPSRGDHGLLFALGPAFCAEMVLLQW